MIRQQHGLSGDIADGRHTPYPHVRAANPEHKAAFRSGDADTARKVLAQPAGIDFHVALINLPHPAHMPVVMSFTDKCQGCQLCGGYIGAANGIFHLQQALVVTTGNDPAYTQAGCNGFGK